MSSQTKTLRLTQRKRQSYRVHCKPRRRESDAKSRGIPIEPSSGPLGLGGSVASNPTGHSAATAGVPGKQSQAPVRYRTRVGPAGTSLAAGTAIGTRAFISPSPRCQSSGRWGSIINTTMSHRKDSLMAIATSAASSATVADAALASVLSQCTE